MSQKPSISRRGFLRITAITAAGLAVTAMGGLAAKIFNKRPASSAAATSTSQAPATASAGAGESPTPVTTSPPTPSSTPTQTPGPTATATTGATATPTPGPAASATPETVKLPIPGTYTYIDGVDGDINTATDNVLNGIAEVPKTLNLGKHANFEAAPKQNGLFRFDLSAIPATATCIDATLYLYKSYQLGDGGGSPVVTVYSVAQANADWFAGLGDLDLAARGESCWNALAADGAGGVLTPWAGGANGCGISGTDYEAAPLGSITIKDTNLRSIGTEYLIALTPARIQGWFGSPNTNYGLLIRTVGGGDHFAKAANRTPAYRPKLVVTYRVN